jgi:transcriptional regulator with XRE-family HTH domain
MDSTPVDPSTPFKLLGARIKAEREDQGLTQRELAELAGIHETHLSRIEAGLVDPKLSMLTRIALALRVNLSELTDRLLPPGRRRRLRRRAAQERGNGPSRGSSGPSGSSGD